MVALVVRTPLVDIADWLWPPARLKSVPLLQSYLAYVNQMPEHAVAFQG